MKVSIHLKRSKPKPSIVYETYWRFAAERQRIFFRRQKEGITEWTKDPILQSFKFTNAYRAADRTSQYLINQVIYNGEEDSREVFFRIMLFKLFNKIKTWEGIIRECGEVSFQTFNFEKYRSILASLRKENGAIYSGAYIMASGKRFFQQERKHENHLLLLEKMMSDLLPERISKVSSMKSLYDCLLTYPTIGPFLAYQLTIDINYSTLTDFSEMDFVKAGPGALDGIRKCFLSIGDYSPEDVIRMVTESQSEEFDRYGIEFADLWGRPLQLIDCQNLFCEVDKYARIAHPLIEGVSNRTRIKQKFKASTKNRILYAFPPKWGLNGNLMGPKDEWKKKD